MTTIYDFTARDLSGEDIPLGRFRNQVLLVVNTASKCGFTPQYLGLTQLHEDLSRQGFAVLGFPCNQFGKQEPGDAAEIKVFCRETYDVRFPIFDKIAVNGARAHPLYRWLKGQARGILGTRSIKWNFTKFLIDREGKVTRRFSPMTKPVDIRPQIEALL
ncbi:MAG TPA: glutathione peroxidase [Dongiaceae bacterium]